MQCTAVQTRSPAPSFVLLRDSHPRRPASRRNKPELLVQHSDATFGSLFTCAEDRGSFHSKRAAGIMVLNKNMLLCS